MNILVISDIHGGIGNLNNVLDRETYDEVFFLGDMFSYNGDDNDLLVREKLEEINATMVKGNCDRGAIPYTINREINGKIFTLTHGHIYNENQLPEDVGNVLLLGHTHVGQLIKKGNLIIANPGSIYKSRSPIGETYILINDENIYLKNLKGKIIKSMKY